MSKVKKIIFVFLSFIVFFASCKKDNLENGYRRNPYIFPPNIEYKIYLNLPKYSKLQTVMVPVVVKEVGVKGVIVICTSVDKSYVGWDLACPNHRPEDCEPLTIEGFFATCKCDGIKYNLLNGGIVEGADTKEKFPLIPYRVLKIDANTIVIRN